MVTNVQLYLAVGVPLVVNSAMLLLVYAALSRRLDDFKDLWRAELRRVEEILDARLKHL